MSSPNRQPQGHYLGIDNDKSLTLHFSQYIGDFSFSGNIVYTLLALLGVVAIAMAAQHYGMSDGMTIFLALCLGVAAVALRIKIFNQYAFVMKQVKVSPQGDLEWPGRWLEHAEIHQLQVESLPGSAGQSKVVCVLHSGERHVIGDKLPQVRAAAICRDLSNALGTPVKFIPLSLATNAAVAAKA